MSGGADIRAAALAAARGGRTGEAARFFEQGMVCHPGDAGFHNAAGNFHAGQGDDARALACFDRALTVDPRQAEAAVNRAIVLTRLSRAAEAVAFLTACAPWLAHHPRFRAVLGAAALEAEQPALAVRAYDAVLARDPHDARALQGRALASLQTGSADAIAWHERALAAVPGDRHVALGLAQALEADGHRDEALSWAQALATQLPDWTPGLERLAALRWARGERDGFADHYAAAAATPEVCLSWAGVLAGVDRHAAAADVAADGARRWPDRHDLALMEAVEAGAAGDDARADAAFARHPQQAWATDRARHALRRGDPLAAEALLAQAVDVPSDAVAAWSLRAVAWRMLGDARHDWLAAQPGLIRELDLGLDMADMAALTATLDALHDRAAMPIGQSVKDGSQTRGSLFARDEPAIATVRAAIDRALVRYRDGLPPADASHPLLRRRDAAWAIAGSWSIRLDGRGRHAAHIHPKGIVSSAAYVAVPSTVDEAGAPGWLEIGRPPADLRTGLPALAAIRPRPGHCVLFPSFLFHGTRPLASGRRMTVAFDVA